MIMTKKYYDENINCYEYDKTFTTESNIGKKNIRKIISYVNDLLLFALFV